MLVITKLCRAIYLSSSLLLISLDHLSSNPKFVVQFVRRQMNVVAHSLHMYHGLVPMFLSIYQVGSIKEKTAKAVALVI